MIRNAFWCDGRWFRLSELRRAILYAIERGRDVRATADGRTPGRLVFANPGGTR